MKTASDADLLTELTTDPAGLGYRNADGSWKSASQIGHLLGMAVRANLTVSPDWQTSDVLAMARGMCETGNFSAMPFLADALQDAGCDHDGLLHCMRNQTAPQSVVRALLSQESDTEHGRIVFDYCRASALWDGGAIDLKRIAKIVYEEAWLEVMRDQGEITHEQYLQTLAATPCQGER